MTIVVAGLVDGPLVPIMIGGRVVDHSCTNASSNHHHAEAVICATSAGVGFRFLLVDAWLALGGRLLPPIPDAMEGIQDGLDGQLPLGLDRKLPLGELVVLLVFRGELLVGRLLLLGRLLMLLLLVAGQSR